MAGGSDYIVATASQLGGSRPPTKREIEELRLQRVNAMDHANTHANQQLRSEPRKSVRFTPSTDFRASEGDGNAADPTGTDIFTQSPHASRGSVSSINFPKSLPKVKLVEQPTLETLKAVAYSPSSSTSSEGSKLDGYSTSPGGSKANAKKRVNESQAQTDDLAESLVDLHVNTDDFAHKRSQSGSSLSSRRGQKYSQTFEIYFTPVDITKSQISLSSPVGSPELPSEDAEDDLPTPRQSRRSSQIYVGKGKTPARIKAPAQRKDTFRITPAQMDRLIIALATSSMLKKHVQNSWFDIEDVPDDDSIISSFSQVSWPTLTSASTLYSQQNDNIHGPPSAPREPVSKPPSLPRSFGGVALIDAKMFASPVRFVTKNYIYSQKIMEIGDRTHVAPPYGPEIECALRVEIPPDHILIGNVQVLLQCTNQLVDRKSGKKVHVLAVEEDVTDKFHKAVIAELAEATGRSVDDIEVSDSRSPLPTQSPEIDWTAVADELQAQADITDMVDNTCALFAKLDPETCAMESLTLMSALERIKDQHQDCIVLRPTAFHENGLPSNMRIPWVSQKVYQDWYAAADGLGNSDAAKRFQTCIVANVAKRAAAGEEFTCEAYWDDMKMVVECVPLMETAEGKSDAWACFVLGIGKRPRRPVELAV